MKTTGPPFHVSVDSHDQASAGDSSHEAAVVVKTTQWGGALEPHLLKKEALPLSTTANYTSNATTSTHTYLRENVADTPKYSSKPELCLSINGVKRVFYTNIAKNY